MDSTTLILLAVFCLGFICIAMFARTNNTAANKVIFFGSAFLGSMFLYNLLGTFFILNDYSFSMGYYEARLLNSIAFEKYLNFSLPIILVFMATLFIYRRIFKGREMFAAKA